MEWANPYSYNTIETASGYYSLSDNNCSFEVTTPYNLKLNNKWVTKEINDFTWSYNAYSDNQSVGTYTAQRLLGTVSLQPGEKVCPIYSDLTFGYAVTGYSSKDSSVARVDATTGEITAADYGRTYINVETSEGAGVYEVYVRQPVIPYDFAACLGQDESKVKEILGAKPDYSTDKLIAYFNPTDMIDMIGVSIDDKTRLVKAVSITYNSTVDVEAVTTELGKKYIPFTSQTTDTYKAFMDTEQVKEATVGITWDIPNLLLTYVNLAK